MIDPLLQLIVALPLALLFFLAARHKQAEGAHFEAQLGAYALVPDRLLPAAARIIPVVELVIALLLLLPMTRGMAAMAAAVLLAVYGLAMAINVLRGKTDIDCGCGAGPQPVSSWLVSRNIVLVAAAVLVALPAAPRVLGGLDVVMLALFAPLFAALYAMAGELMTNHSVLRTWSRKLG